MGPTYNNIHPLFSEKPIWIMKWGSWYLNHQRVVETRIWQGFYPLCVGEIQMKTERKHYETLLYYFTIIIVLYSFISFFSFHYSSNYILPFSEIGHQYYFCTDHIHRLFIKISPAFIVEKWIKKIKIKPVWVHINWSVWCHFIISDVRSNIILFISSICICRQHSDDYGLTLDILLRWKWGRGAKLIGIYAGPEGFSILKKFSVP